MGLAALPLTAVVVVGLVVIGSAGSIDRDRRPTATVGLVQPALEPHWYELAPALASARRVIFERLFALSQEVRQADLIVWPEGALPAGSGQLPRNIGADGGTPRTILAGAVTHVGGSRFNSVVHLSEGGSETVFNKLALVPVGEAGFTPGSSLAVGDWGGIWSAPLICLDSLFPQFTRRLARLGAEVLIVVSDDSFAQRMATPQLHLRASAFRAVETGLPLVFVSAHGPSAVVGPRGEVLARTEFGEPDALIADIPAPEPETFYVRYGDFVGFISLVVTICLVLLLARDPARLSRY